MCMNMLLYRYQQYCRDDYCDVHDVLMNNHQLCGDNNLVGEDKFRNDITLL